MRGLLGRGGPAAAGVAAAGCSRPSRGGFGPRGCRVPGRGAPGRPGWAPLRGGAIAFAAKKKEKGKGKGDAAGAEGEPARSIFCFGCGYTALALASLLQQEGWVVRGTASSKGKAVKLEEAGIEAFLFSEEEQGALDAIDAALAASSHVLVSIPPVIEEDGEGRDIVLESFQKALKKLSKPKKKKGKDGTKRKVCSLKWLGYLSTTQVYGDWEGGWVDEKSEPRTMKPKLQRRVEVEERWMDCIESDIPVHLFRLAGIYGPTRSLLHTVKAGKSVSKKMLWRLEKKYTSRCHVADVCAALRASMADPDPGATYCIVDDEPASRREVLGYIGELLDVEVEQIKGAAKPPEYVEEKRVFNAVMKDTLGVELKYPTYKEGLKAISDGEIFPFNPEVLEVLNT